MATIATTASKSSTSPSFLSQLTPTQQQGLSNQLHAFVVRHASHHRPIVLVTSGGTAADLEVNAVRSLDNFSTGLRGAISVEQFLSKGYAVVHLWRLGSASPYGRILSHALGIAQANHGITNEAFGKLLCGADNDDDDDCLVNKVLQVDPWLTESTPAGEATIGRLGLAKSDGSLGLHRRLIHHSQLQKAVRERKASEGRLLTVSFRTVEEYLAKLELCATSLKDSQSMAMCYLAAAVSDFYVAKKSHHKIQSDGHVLTLELHPVPKCLGSLKEIWCPDAMTVSFKLETDHTILRKKAEKAVYKYGVNMVIGNLLQSRHEKVWILHSDKEGASVQDWDMHEIAKATGGGDVDALEEAIVEFCVQQHFEFISKNYMGDISQLEHSQQELRQKKFQLQRQVLRKRVQQGAFQLGGGLLGMTLSYIISKALQKRLK